MKKYLHEFNRYMSGAVRDNGWWEIKDGYCVNRVGGKHKYIPREDDIIVEAERIEELDWSCLIDNEMPYGWISPDGKFYGCSYMGHKDLAELYFKASERELEDKGYAKIYRTIGKDRGYFVFGYLSKKQKEIIVEKGLMLQEIDKYR